MNPGNDTTSATPQLPQMMRAITQRRYGGPDTLEYGNVPRPVPGAGEVLIRVLAASVNAADWLLMHGEPLGSRLAFGLRGPRTRVRGRDAAGIVEAVGDRVDEFAVGDAVYGEVDAGSFADYTVAPAQRLAIMPERLRFEQAAAVPTAATTALQAIRDKARVNPGDRVLINGASGGVGSFAVQIAKAYGASVTGVCSTRNLDLVTSLGADHVIDYSREDFTTGESRYDVFLDLIGNRSLAECRRVLTRRGTLVLSSGSGSRLLGPVGRMLSALVVGMFVSQNLRPLAAVANGRDLDVLRDMIQAGAVTPHIERVYPLAEAPAALRHFGVQHARGKIVIVVEPQQGDFGS